MENYPKFHNEVGARTVRIGCREFKCLGTNRRKITHTSTSIWARPVTSSAPIALRYSVSIRAWVRTKLIRQIVLMVTWSELKNSNTASLIMQAAANQRHRPAFGAVHDNRERSGLRQDASVTTAEPAIAVARDRVIDHVVDHPQDEVEDPFQCQRGSVRGMRSTDLDFYIALAVRQEGKGFRVINGHDAGRDAPSHSCRPL